MQLLDACNISPCFGVVCRSKLWPEWSASNFVRFCAFLLTQLPNTVNPQNAYECTLDNGQCTTSHFHNRSTFATNLWRINLCNGVSPATGRQSGHRGRFTHYNMCWTVRSSNSRTATDLLFSTTPRPALGPIQPPIQYVYFPGIRRTWGEIDHPPPSNAKAMNDWSYTAIWTGINLPSIHGNSKVRRRTQGHN